MEARRLAILSSHLQPIGPRRTRVELNFLSPTICASASEDAEGLSRRNNCVFCRIARGESPCVKLYEDDMCLCILDTNPLSRGHSLIIPKAHFSSLQATPPSVVAAMCSKVPFLSHAIMKATGCDSFNMLVNNGVAAGQVIFHTHIHIIPRKKQDCLWTTESLHRRSMKLDKEARQLASLVQEELLNLSEESKDLESNP